MTEEGESGVCPFCEEICGKERSACLARYKEKLSSYLKELTQLRRYKNDNEKTLANYRTIAQKFILPPLSGGRMIGDKKE